MVSHNLQITRPVLLHQPTGHCTLCLLLEGIHLPSPSQSELLIYSSTQTPAAALLCRTYLIQHPISSVSSPEREKSPRYRCCIGSIVKIRLCPHRIFTLEELQHYPGPHDLIYCPGRATFGWKEFQQSLLYIGRTEIFFMDYWPGCLLGWFA
jgi:hypothetical protein